MARDKNPNWKRETNAALFTNDTCKCTRIYFKHKSPLYVGYVIHAQINKTRISSTSIFDIGFFDRTCGF